MQFPYTVLLALVATVSAQTIASEMAQLPSCSLSCLQNAISAAGCATDDYNCQCNTQLNAITASASPCVLKACSVSEATDVQSITSEICKLGLAQASSAGGSSATSAASSASSSAASVSSSVSSEISSVASSAVSSSTAADTSGASSLSSATSAASASATSSAASQQSTGGAAQLQAGLGVMGAAVIAAMAL